MLIDKVRYCLHPTFGVDYIDVEAKEDTHFELVKEGWGVFTLPVIIHWNKTAVFQQPY